MNGLCNTDILNRYTPPTGGSQLAATGHLDALGRTDTSCRVRGRAVGVTTIQILFIDAAINQVDSPQCENKLRLVRLSLPLRRMFLQKVAIFTLHDPNSDCFATGFCEARCSLRSGNAPQKLVSRVAVGCARASIIGVYHPFLLPEQ